MGETSTAPSRRAFLTGVSTLAGIALPHVHAAENNTIQLALVGCGGPRPGRAANTTRDKKWHNQARPDGRRLSAEIERQPRPPAQKLFGAHGRPAEAAVHRLRRLRKSHGRSE